MKKDNKMISIEIKFWTNDINPEGGVMPKHAWDSGYVTLHRNDKHEISSTPPKMFKSLMQLNSVIEEMLVEQGIQLHQGRLAQLYYSK